MSKSQRCRWYDINIRAVVTFREIGKGLEGVQNVTCCLNMFSIGDPSYHTINEEFLRACEYVANKSMAKAASEVSANAHDLSLILTDATFANRKEVTFAIRKIIHLARIHFHELASSKYFTGISFREWLYSVLNDYFRFWWIFNKKETCIQNGVVVSSSS